MKSKLSSLLAAMLGFVLFASLCSCEDNRYKFPEAPESWTAEFVKEHPELEYAESEADGVYSLTKYLEDKYNTEFEFVSYTVSTGLLMNNLTPTLLVYPKGAEKTRCNIVTAIYKDNAFSDDYMLIAVRPYYEELLRNYVSGYFGSDKIAVFAGIRSTGFEMPEDITPENLGEMGAANIIFIDSSICTEDEMKLFSNNLLEWCMSNNVSGLMRITLVQTDDISEINDDNYDDYFVNPYYIADEFYYFDSENGKS